MYNYIDRYFLLFYIDILLVLQILISGQISDLIEPFDKLDEKTNLALFTIKDKKVLLKIFNIFFVI